ncbi:MAG TPA: histidine kinase [Chloroflexota bacterium]|jgi:signal transduction histidine kinase|nr:histidine kinase [Chloroflexota bacterium]
MRHLRLRYQIALATFVPLIVFGLLAGVVGSFALRKIPEELVLERQTALAQVTAAGVAGNLRGYVRLLERTADEVAQHADDPSRQREIVRERADVLSVFTGGASLLDGQGTAVAATPDAEWALGVSFADQGYFREVATGLVPAFSTERGEPVASEGAVVIAVPVRHGGAFAGAVVGKFALSRPDWARDLNLLRTSAGGRAYVLDRTSTIVFHPDARLVGTSIQADPDLWRLVIGGEARSILYRSPDSGQVLVVAYAPVPGIAGGVIAEEPWETIAALVVPYQWAVGGLLALGIALAVVALVLSVRRVTRPLGAIIAAGERVAGGKPYEMLAVEGPPDLETLVLAINRMVAHLSDQQEALRRYALRVLQGQEDERLRISRELHDETVQDLVSLGQRLELCADALEEDPAAARRRLREVERLARKALIELRRMSNNLRPSALEDLGLVPAVRALTGELAEQLGDTEVCCEVVGRELRLSPELELTAFRIAQEALTNVRRHAKTATRVDVALIFAEWGLALLVEDDGCGFAAPDRDTLMREGHLGLVGMVERAQLFGGELRIASTPGEGTTVTLRLPLGEAEEDRPIGPDAGHLEPVERAADRAEGG